MIFLYHLEVKYYAQTFFKRIIQPYYTFSNEYPLALHFFKRIKRKPCKSFRLATLLNKLYQLLKDYLKSCGINMSEY